MISKSDLDRARFVSKNGEDMTLAEIYKSKSSNSSKIDKTLNKIGF